MRHLLIASPVVACLLASAAPAKPLENEGLYFVCINARSDPDWSNHRADVPPSPSLRISACTALIAAVKSGQWPFTEPLFGSPNNSDYLLSVLLMHRGDGFIDARDPTRAIADYDEAIRLSPSYDVPYGHRAKAYEALGRLAPATGSKLSVEQ